MSCCFHVEAALRLPGSISRHTQSTYRSRCWSRSGPPVVRLLASRGPAGPFTSLQARLASHNNQSLNRAAPPHRSPIVTWPRAACQPSHVRGGFAIPNAAGEKGSTGCHHLQQIPRSTPRGAGDITLGRLSPPLPNRPARSRLLTASGRGGGGGGRTGCYRSTYLVPLCLNPATLLRASLRRIQKLHRSFFSDVRDIPECGLPAYPAAGHPLPSTCQ
ncbi:hypothetical protein QBC34DRAFT_173261 [Podospora aff. communis PSN243]|uniref:Uncharacterized protein n=1 Tax=Podospora aff. communis PSN243 TaxID=3040156 RepID=A0AAV9H1L5_9PEZI|nr:hypothetical protein QBC34DRAFT_173261 [Podospora aff. communis PSN243]